jgi:hypothetical protein
MGNSWRNKADPDEYRVGSQVCNWRLRGSWVDVHLETVEHVNLSDDDSIVMVNIIAHDQKSDMPKTVPQPGMLLSADETVSNNSPSTSSVDWSLDAQHETVLDLEKEQVMEVGEVTENKKAAIMATLRRHSTQLCKGVSITCLVAILYSNNVTGSPVFSGLSNAVGKSEYLVQEILAAVEREPAKFEDVRSSIALAHSPAYGRLLWTDYERELAVYERTSGTFCRLSSE